MADVTFTSFNRAEQVRAVNASALLVLADKDSCQIFVDVPDGLVPEPIVDVVRMGAMVIRTLRELGALDAAQAAAAQLSPNAQWRVGGQPAGPDDVLRKGPGAPPLDGRRN